MAKIQVQGIGVYDDKTLKKKIIDMANNLSKLAKKGEWSKSSENGIRALGRMWGAYQNWSRQNESITEGPDADLGKKLKQVQNQIYKLGHQYKSKANVPAMMRSFMLGVQSQLKKDKLTEAIKKWKDVPEKGTLDFGKYGKYVILSKNKMRINGKFVSGSNKGKSVKWYSRDGQKDARKRKGMSISDTPQFPFGMVKEDMKNTSKVMKAVRKGPKVGPWNIIVSKNNNIVKRVLVKNLKEIPAEMSDLRDRYPNYVIGIESKVGKIVYREGYSMRDIGLSPFFKKLNSVQRQAVSIALVMGGNMTGAVKAIEKIKKGLSKDKKVRNALKLANESTMMKEGPQRDMNNMALYIIDLNKELSNAKALAKKHPKYKKYIKFIQQDIKDAEKKLKKVKQIKLRSKSGMGTISHFGMES